MEIRQLRTFRTVARLLSFHQAAKRLDFAQSSVSARIQALEEELDVKLFDRMGRRIRLTDAGRRLLRYAEKIVDLADESRADVAGVKEPRGALTIRIPESLGTYRLPEVIRRFRSRCPKVRLRFTTCAQEGLRKDLRKGITDLAFLLTESVNTVDLEVEALGVEPLALVAGAGHPLAGKEIVHSRDLEGESFLLSRVDCSYRKMFEQVVQQENVHLDKSLEFNCVAALKRCVSAGVGFSILPKIAVEEDVARGRLIELPWSEGEVEAAILMIWYKEKWLSPALTAFMDAARETLKQK